MTDLIKNKSFKLSPMSSKRIKNREKARKGKNKEKSKLRAKRNDCMYTYLPLVHINNRPLKKRKK